MLLRCVLSAVCVVFLAPVAPARARASDDPISTVTLRGPSVRLPDRRAVQDLGTEALTRTEPRITLEASGVIKVQSPGDGNVQGGPPVVVLESPKITCPMVMVAADPEIDSVAPTACR
jgi:hypothetical protein